MSRSNNENITSTIKKLVTKLLRLTHNNHLKNCHLVPDIQQAIIEQLKIENSPSPKVIRCLIYDCYRVLANSRDIQPEITDSCIATSIKLIQTMGTIDYFNRYYSPNTFENNCDSLKNRLQELANIFSAVGVFAETGKLPRTVNITELLLPLIKQFKVLAERILSISGVQSDETIMDNIALSFNGFFFAMYQLSINRYLIVSNVIRLMVDRCYHSSNNRDTISNSLQTLSDLISYLETKNNSVASQQPLSVRVDIAQQPPAATANVAIAQQALMQPTAINTMTQLFLNQVILNQIFLNQMQERQTNQSQAMPPRPTNVGVGISPQPTTTVRVGVSPIGGQPPQEPVTTPAAAATRSRYSFNAYGNSPETVRVYKDQRPASRNLRRSPN